MKNINDHFTEDLFEPWEQIGQKRKQMLKEGWAEVFRETVFPNLPVKEVGEHFDDNMGRPSTELYTFTGIPVLQQILDLTDRQMQQAVAFDIRIHYALDIQANTDRNTYVSLKTIWTARDIMVEEGLADEIFEGSTEALIEAFGTDTSKQRIDSSAIRSNMKEMGRVRMMAEVARRFLREVRKQQEETFTQEVPERIRNRYIGEEQEATFSRNVKPSQANRKGREVARDLYELYLLFEEDPVVGTYDSFAFIERVLEEQCEITHQQEEEEKITLVEASEVPADSLQNPSDPDAAYDGHKGTGYLVQLMETYQPDRQEGETSRSGGEETPEQSESGESNKRTGRGGTGEETEQKDPEPEQKKASRAEEEEEEGSNPRSEADPGSGSANEARKTGEKKGEGAPRPDGADQDQQKQKKEEEEKEEEKEPLTPNFLTYVNVEPIDHVDEEALPEAIEEADRRELLPNLLLGDTRYGSDENVREADRKGVRLVSPIAGRDLKEGKLHLSDFQWEGGEPEACPKGKSPEQLRETDRGNVVAEFAEKACAGCPKEQMCPVKKEPGGRRLRYSPKQSRNAKRRQFEQTEQFNETYRWRAGVEGTASQYKRNLRNGKIPYRGAEKMQFSGVMKGLAVNISRAANALKEGDQNPFVSMSPAVASI